MSVSGSGIWSGSSRGVLGVLGVLGRLAPGCCQWHFQWFCLCVWGWTSRGRCHRCPAAVRRAHWDSGCGIFVLVMRAGHEADIGRCNEGEGEGEGERAREARCG